jgi:hypothetical protein
MGAGLTIVLEYLTPCWAIGAAIGESHDGQSDPRPIDRRRPRESCSDHAGTVRHALLDHVSVSPSSSCDLSSPGGCRLCVLCVAP